MLARLKHLSAALPIFSTSQRTVRTMAQAANPENTETAIVANGCFWGTEHMYRKHYDGKGLLDAEVGFIGGDLSNPSYRQVCSGTTNHAEATKLVFDNSKVSYEELIEFHYRMHDPTTLNRQGGDIGTQYRSAIFYLNPQQKEIAERVTEKVQKERFDPNGKKIVTQILEAGEWWPAEDYHQKYLINNPSGYHCPTHRLYW
ncbi:methionine sulfoxide reductase A [Atractiella rhizophila]|nr:methionine sulfoxide reductase A [Atractiella rhizophila]